MAKQFKKMGGRRSRYWCGPGSFRETKKAPVRGFIGQWSAPVFGIRRAACRGRAAGLFREGFEGEPYLITNTQRLGSDARLVENAVELCPVFLNRRNPHSRDCQQLRSRTRSIF